MTETERIAKLTADAKKGDAAAFESLYAAYGKRVYYFCRGLLGEETAAADATKDAFVYAWRNIHTLTAGQTFYRWICGNAFYFAKIALASMRGTGITIESVEDGDPTLFDTMNDPDGPASVEPSIRRGDLDTVTAIIDSMSDSDRICVLLYDYASFTEEEAAGIAGCSVSTLKCRVYAAHQAILAGMEDKAPGSGSALKPYVGRLLRTCGRNCSMPASVTESIREGLRDSEGEDFTAKDLCPDEDKPFTLTKKTTTVLYIVLALLLVGALAYVVYWFATSPDDTTSSTSSQTASTNSDIGGSSSEEESAGDIAVSTDDSAAVSSGETSDESEPAESSAEESSESSSSAPAESSASEETSVDTTPAELPRTTTRLRMRSTPDTSVTDNIIATIPANTHVEILDTVTAEDGGIWYYVRYNVSPGMWHDGYCFAEYIETEE